MIDARDLAAFVLHVGADDVAGTFNVAVPPERHSLGELIETSSEAAGSSVDVAWCDPEFVAANELLVSEESDPFPLITPDEPNAHLFDTSHAVANGLTFRTLEATVSDTLAWDRAREVAILSAGLAAQREAETLRPGRRHPSPRHPDPGFAPTFTPAPRPPIPWWSPSDQEHEAHATHGAHRLTSRPSSGSCNPMTGSPDASGRGVRIPPRSSRGSRHTCSKDPGPGGWGGRGRSRSGLAGRPGRAAGRTAELPARPRRRPGGAGVPQRLPASWPRVARRRRASQPARHPLARITHGSTGSAATCVQRHGSTWTRWTRPTSPSSRRGAAEWRGWLFVNASGDAPDLVGVPRQPRHRGRRLRARVAAPGRETRIRARLELEDRPSRTTASATTAPRIHPELCRVTAAGFQPGVPGAIDGGVLARGADGPAGPRR